MTNPTPPNQRHHGASASPPSMPTPPTEASLSAEERDHWPVESFVREEMDERGWNFGDFARYAGLTLERAGQFLHLGMWGDDLPPALETAFGIDAQTWQNLWLRDVGRELERLATIDALTTENATSVDALLAPGGPIERCRERGLLFQMTWEPDGTVTVFAYRLETIMEGGTITFDRQRLALTNAATPARSLALAACAALEATE